METIEDQAATVLLVAADLIDRGFCRHSFARDENGANCRPMDPTAVSFCAVGAIWRAANGKRYLMAAVRARLGKHLHLATDQRGDHRVMDWNDEHTGAEVSAAMRAAAATTPKEDPAR